VSPSSVSPPAPLDRVPESASEHLRNGLQILTQPHEQIDADDLERVRRRLAQALVLVEPEVAPEHERERSCRDV